MSGISATSSGALAVGTTTIAPKTNGIGSGMLCGASLSAAAAAATLTISDGASGLVLEIISVPANTSFIIDYAHGTVFNSGLVAVVTGTGAQAVVRYVLGG